MRIRARAIRRCGELLKEIEAKAHRSKKGVEADLHLSSRDKAAHEAGLSKDQKHQALRLANISGESFERQIESDQPKSALPSMTINCES